MHKEAMVVVPSKLKSTGNNKTTATDLLVIYENYRNLLSKGSDVCEKGEL